MRVFKLTDGQEELVKKFKADHSHCAKEMPSGTDGTYQFSYIVTPGGVGTTISIRCNHCKKIQDITEYNNW